MEDRWCLESVSRTPQSDTDRARLDGTASCATIVVLRSSLRQAQVRTSTGVPLKERKLNSRLQSPSQKVYSRSMTHAAC